MPRVLIPSDNRDFVAQLAGAYRRRGWDVAVGVANFDLRVAGYDLVHLQWPEELCGWEPPSPARAEAIIRALEAWSAESRLLLTVHNLYPHRHHGEPRYRALYEAVYERVPVIAHFTETSRRLVAAEFSAAARQRNIVTGFFTYADLLPARRDPVEARRRLGFAEDDFVVLSFGMLRDWAEARLIRDAFTATRVVRKRLLMAGRYQEFGAVWRQRFRRWSWARWLRKSKAVVMPGFVPDAEVHGILDAADVLVVPRFDVLNSGLVALAATFGKLFIAPDCTGFPELAAGTPNLLYQPGDPASLAAALEQAATLDRAVVAEQNRALADSWSWDKIVSVGLEAVGLS